MNERVKSLNTEVNAWMLVSTLPASVITMPVHERGLQMKRRHTQHSRAFLFNAFPCHSFDSNWIGWLQTL